MAHMEPFHDPVSRRCVHVCQRASELLAEQLSSLRVELGSPV